jgi:hypothetical protein
MEILPGSDKDEMLSNFGAQNGVLAMAGKKIMMEGVTKVFAAGQYRTVATNGGETADYMLDAMGKAFSKAGDFSEEFLDAMQGAASELGIRAPTSFMLQNKGGFTGFYNSASKHVAVLLSMPHSGQPHMSTSKFKELDATCKLAGGVLAGLLLVAKFWRDRESMRSAVASLLERLRKSTSKAMTEEEFSALQSERGE